MQTTLYAHPLASADRAFRALPSSSVADGPRNVPVVLKVDACPQRSGERFRDTYGLVLAGPRISRDTSVCDLWLAPPAIGQAPTLLVAGGRGGIRPLFAEEYAQSALFEQTQAPTQGYCSRYVLTGKEAGFFIRTRDGQHYGKYVFARAGGAFNAASTTAGEPLCQYWWNGSCLYQPTGSRNLAPALAQVDLLTFLQGRIP
ncbi:hypothetical protein [Hymenobacter crusticola]|uniref:Uncharacterized protein n=1 Tax=Hymenobacter crusticola TaxID=1770526 RepID=A0A243W561_9BACT|nr:hypothetical protein [Hymenobacter crusticola]OUJ67192.1 hypothetical protein BXP70_28920 [Hymenobacter crusticola]